MLARYKKILLIGLFACVVLAQAARAEDVDYINPDRPGLTDGSNVVGAGYFQIETGMQQEFRKIP